MRQGSRLAADDFLFFSQRLELLVHPSLEASTEASGDPANHSELARHIDAAPLPEATPDRERLLSCRRLAAWLITPEVSHLPSAALARAGVSWRHRLERARALLHDAERLESCEEQLAARDAWMMARSEWRGLIRSRKLRQALHSLAIEQKVPQPEECVQEVLISIEGELLPTLHMKWFLKEAVGVERFDGQTHHQLFHVHHLRKFKPSESRIALKELFAWYQLSRVHYPEVQNEELGSAWTRTPILEILVTLLRLHWRDIPLRTALLDEYLGFQRAMYSFLRYRWCVKDCLSQLGQLAALDAGDTTPLALLSARATWHALAAELQLTPWIQAHDGQLFLYQRELCPEPGCPGSLLSAGLCSVTGPRATLAESKDKPDSAEKGPAAEEKVHPIADGILHCQRALLWDSENGYAHSLIERTRVVGTAATEKFSDGQAAVDDPVRIVVDNVSAGMAMAGQLRRSPEAEAAAQRERRALVELAVDRLQQDLADEKKRAALETLCQEITNLLGCEDPKWDRRTFLEQHPQFAEFPWDKIDAAIEQYPTARWMAALVPSSTPLRSFVQLAQGFQPKTVLASATRWSSFRLRTLSWIFSWQGIPFKAAAVVGFWLALQAAVSLAHYNLSHNQQQKLYLTLLQSVRSGDQAKIISESGELVHLLQGDLQDPRLLQVAGFLERATLERILELEQAGNSSGAQEILAKYEHILSQPPLSLLSGEVGAESEETQP